MKYEWCHYSLLLLPSESKSLNGDFAEIRYAVRHLNVTFGVALSNGFNFWKIIK